MKKAILTFKIYDIIKAILTFKMYDIIDKLIEEKFSNENYFVKFTDFKDKSLGDEIDVD
jgi:hypothetical protein